MLVELVNTLALTYFGTECLLRRRVKFSKEEVAGAVLSNIVAWVLTLAGNHFSLHFFAAWLASHPLIDAILLLNVITGLLAAFKPGEVASLRKLLVLTSAKYSVKLRRWSMIVGAAIIVIFLMLATGMLMMRFQNALLSVTRRKVFISAISYPAMCFADFRRSSPHLRPLEFLAMIPRALLMTALLFPVLSVLVSLVLLILCGIVELMGYDPHILNMPIYYGVLYGPFITFYWSLKRKFLSSLSELPY